MAGPAHLGSGRSRLQKSGSRRVLRNESEDRDVTQDVFSRLWNHPYLTQLEDPCTPFSWLNRTAGPFDAIRSLNTRRCPGVRGGQLTVAAIYDINNKAWDLALSDHVTGALDGLAEQERKVIEPGYFEGHTHVEVARATTFDVPLVDSTRGNQTKTPSNKSLAANK